MDSGFGQAFKLGQRRGLPAPVVVAVSYFTLGLVLSLFLTLRGTALPPAEVWMLGMVMGAAFLPTMLLFNHALQRIPVGMAVTTFRMGILLPIMVGVYIWGETMSARQAGGAALGLVALVLMTRARGATSWLPSRSVLGLLAVIFGMQGLCFTLMRAVQYRGLGDYQITILAVTGLTAGALGFGFVALRRIPVDARAFAFGGAIGSYNSLTLPVVMTALSHLPGTQYFPLAACGAVVLDNLYAHFVWRERLTLLNAVGVLIAVMSLVLVVS